MPSAESKPASTRERPRRRGNAYDGAERFAIRFAPMPRLFTDPDALARLCRQHHIRRLSLFGSTLRGAGRPDSDVDLLVEFEPGATPGLIRLAAMAREFSSLLGGRAVDLRTPDDLSRYFRDDILRTAQVHYAG